MPPAERHMLSAHFRVSPKVSFCQKWASATLNLLNVTFQMTVCTSEEAKFPCTNVQSHYLGPSVDSKVPYQLPLKMRTNNNNTTTTANSLILIIIIIIIIIIMGDFAFVVFIRLIFSFFSMLSGCEENIRLHSFTSKGLKKNTECCKVILSLSYMVSKPSGPRVTVPTYGSISLSF